jgi:hypothetical protein
MSQVDLGAGARALSGVGQSFSRIGSDVGQYAAKEDADNLRIATARADAAWLSKENELRNSFKDDDPEFQTWGDRYQKGADERRKQIAESLITDRRAREFWLARREGDVVRGRTAIEGRAETRNKDYYYSTGLESLENLKKTYVAAGDDEETRKQVIEAGKGVVEDLRRRGVIDETRAKQFGAQWAAGVAETEVSSLKPLERIALLQGNRAALKARESGGNPSVVNQFGYTGLYQYGAPRLQSLGVYSAGDGEDMGAWSKSGRNAPGKWSGRFNIPGFPEVKTHEDFRRNPAAQEAVAEIDDAFKDREIVQNGLEKYIGQTVGGIPITRDGIRNMIHLGGAGGAKRALESGGAEDRQDANGTSVLEYARLGAGASSKRAARLAEYIAPERRQAIAVASEREHAGFVRQQETEKRQQSADVEALKRDDLAAVESKGTGLAPETLSRAKIAEIQGEEAARLWENERARAQRVFEATDGVQTLPEGEIYSRLEILEPRPNAQGFTNEGYADDMAAYERARKKADRIVQARRSDPALAAEAFDTVKKARASIQYDEDRGVRMIRPESAQTIIGARLAAQSQMGIEQPMAVTKSEAAVIARNLRSIGEENPDGLRKFMEGLNRTYGEYADEVLASTIQHANVNRDLSVLAGQILGKVANGTMPRTDEMRKVDALTDADGLENVMRGARPPAVPPVRRDAFGMRQQMLIRDQAREMASREQQQAQAPATPPAPALANAEGIADIRRLTQDPSLATEFEAKYGPGTAAEALKRWRTMTGR